MDTFLLFGLVGFGCLILGILGYTVTTNKIIKDQDREIEELRHKIKLKDIKIDYLEKSRAQYKEYFDAHKIKVDPVEPSITFTVINTECNNVLEDLFKEF